MDTPDPLQEWQRLTEVYRDKSDEELGLIANVAFDLTDIAKQALQDAINARGLKIELQQTPLATEPEPEPQEAADEEFNPADLDQELNLRSFGQVWSREEALRLHQGLTDAGIAHFFGSENAANVDNIRAPFENGVDVKIRDLDYNRAVQVMLYLDRIDPMAAEVLEEADADTAVLCPKCKSAEVVFLEIVNPEATSVLDTKYRWTCDDCGHDWIDSGVEQESA